MEEPEWVYRVIQRLLAANYSITIVYDTDGQTWQNKLYTVTKGQITYLLNGRAQGLLKIPAV